MYQRVGRSIRYRLSDVDQWLSEHGYANTSQYPAPPTAARQAVDPAGVESGVDSIDPGTTLLQLIGRWICDDRRTRAVVSNYLSKEGLCRTL